MGTLADQILAADDLPFETVDTPEWAPAGVPTLRVRGLTSDERDSYERSQLIPQDDGSYVRNPDLKSIRAGFVARVAVDEAGQRVFTDAQVTALGKKNAAAVDRLWNVARRLSGYLDEEVNPSKGDPDSLSSTGSPSPQESPTPTS